MGILVFVAAAAVLLACLTQWNAWTGRTRFQRTDDAYLRTDLTPLSSRVAGYVTKAPMQDFATVRKGDLLVEIDDADYRADLAKAQADLRAAEAATAGLKAQANLQLATIEAASSTALASRATSGRATSSARRLAVLLAGGAGSQDALEAGDAERDVAAAQHARDAANAVAAERQLGVLSAEIGRSEATAQSARAAAELARITLSRTRAFAPEDGVLGERQVRTGQYLAIGSPITTLARLPRIWIIANFKETQLTNLRIGQPASATVDAFPDVVLRGRVAGYAPATGAQFALLPPDNATGNFTKIVQRLAVKIELDRRDIPLALLRPGMSVVASVDTGRR